MIFIGQHENCLQQYEPCFEFSVKEEQIFRLSMVGRRLHEERGRLRIMNDINAEG